MTIAARIREANSRLETERGAEAFTRVAIALGASKGFVSSAAEYANQRWGRTTASVVKAAMRIDEDSALFDVAATEFFALVAEQSVVGRLATARRVPLGTRLLSTTSPAVGYWVGQGLTKPLSDLAFAAEILMPLKCCGLAVLSDELIRTTGTTAERAVRSELLRAVVATIDGAFLDPNNSGDDATPASILNGATTLPATSDPRHDMRALIDLFAGDLSTSYWIAHPKLLAGLSSADHPDVGIGGGELLGAPVLASRSAPEDTLALVDGAGIVVGEGRAEVRVSGQASINMVSEPATGSPPEEPVPTTQVSLFQANAIGILVEQESNWRVVRAGSVAVLTDAFWGNTSSPPA